MNDHQWEKLLALWQGENKRREKMCQGSLFIMKEEVGLRLDEMHAILNESTLELEVEEAFSPADNAYGINISTWVMDGSALALSRLLALADAYSIDATTEGKIVLSLTLANAAVEWKGEKQ